MTSFDAFRFDGKRVLVVGGASGMGAAAAGLAQAAGAEVVVLDVVEVTDPGVTAIHVDLADVPTIDTAVAQLGDAPIHAVLACAGVADGTPGLEKINFLGHRYLIDRLLAAGLLPRGSAIGFISSLAGMGWQNHLPELQEYLAIDDVDTASKWAHEHEKATYMWSKQVVCAYVAAEAVPLLKHGVRINAICPGPTDTPLARANAASWLGFGTDYRAETGTEVLTPLEQASPLLFLCSPAASAVTGITLFSDNGFFSAGITGSFPGASPVVNHLLNS